MKETNMTKETHRTPKVAGRLVVLAVLAVLGVLGAAAMSMHQQLFLLCVRKAPPAPPLPYDAEVEYLESTGTQVVNTGIYGRDNLLCNIRFALTSISISDNRYIFIGYEGRILLGMFAQGSLQMFRFGVNSGIVSGSESLDLDIHEVFIDTAPAARRVVFDGVVVYSGIGSYSGQLSNPITLLGRSGFNDGCSARIYSFSVTDATTGEKIQDLIPVRKNGVGYVYDRVSGQMLGNSGTGDFVIGPDK